jgi:hypothetical protein
MAEDWPDIPSDVIDWFRNIFAEANRKVAERLANSPNVRETAIDDTLVEALVPEEAPRLLGSGAIVMMQIHNIGGLRQIGRWEIADIAVIVSIYRGETLAHSKVGLLQSKRLYPTNHDVDEDDEIGFRWGMNRFLSRGKKRPEFILHRRYEFAAESRYGALCAGSEQVRAIEAANKQLHDATHYVFYNPPKIPLEIQYPLQSRISVSENPIGCRVCTAAEVHSVLEGLEDHEAPTLEQVRAGSSKSYWRLETWAADLLLTCKVGTRYGGALSDLTYDILYRRSGPIGAAVAVDITLPE